MLDRLKLVQKISLLSYEASQKRVESIVYAQKIWDMLCANSLFLKKHQFWNDSLNDTYPIIPFNDSYTACSIDGSQIYPDRHSGYDYFLINIGGIIIRYSQNIQNPVSFVQEPYVFSLFNESLVSIDWVNAQRYAYELEALVKEGKLLKHESTKPLLLLLDGSLIFWHLDDSFKDKKYYIALYNKHLLEAFKQALSVVAYISRPKSKDLISLANLFIKECISDSAFPELCNGVNDVHLLQHFLLPGFRSTVFLSPNVIQLQYQVESRPCFFYFNVRSEIIRVELPFWLATDRDTVSMIAGLIFDQVIKGDGYPLIIAEAHHHAVVKKNDRDFFYYALEKQSNASFFKEKSSQKQQKKTRMYF